MEFIPNMVIKSFLNFQSVMVEFLTVMEAK